MSNAQFPNDGPINPYAATPTGPGQDAFANRNAETEPASRLSRLGAAIIDGILMMMLIIPIQFATGFTERAVNGQVGIVEQVVMSLLGMIVFLFLFGYLLATRGQTIGKLAAGIRIVDADSNELLPFVRVYVYRYLWTLPFIILTTLIPGPLDDNIGQLGCLGGLPVHLPLRQALHSRFDRQFQGGEGRSLSRERFLRLFHCRMPMTGPVLRSNVLGNVVGRTANDRNECTSIV